MEPIFHTEADPELFINAALDTYLLTGTKPIVSDINSQFCDVIAKIVGTSNIILIYKNQNYQIWTPDPIFPVMRIRHLGTVPIMQGAGAGGGRGGPGEGEELPRPAGQHSDSDQSGASPAFPPTTEQVPSGGTSTVRQVPTLPNYLMVLHGRQLLQQIQTV